MTHPLDPAAATDKRLPDWHPEDFEVAPGILNRIKDAALDDAHFPDPVDRLNNILALIAAEPRE